jgi:Sulfotransferase domain
LPALAQLIARNQTLKQRAVVPTYRAFARTVVFLPPPRVFANSFPKAGTHLLASLLDRLPRMMASGVHRDRGDVTGDDWSCLGRDLRTVRGGQYATGHFPHDPHLVDLLARLDFASLLCLRDPRDIAVSAVGYVTSMPGHELHRRFTEQYSSFDERLMAIITGFEANEHGRGQEDIGTRVGRYVPWLADPATCVVRYEQLIGPAGGGSSDEQRDAVARVAKHVNRPLSGEALDRACARVWSDKSSTFRSGTSGGWRERFTPAHVEAFREVCGRQLIDLGYEHDLDW